MPIIFTDANDEKKQNRGRVVMFDSQNAAQGSIFSPEGWGGFLNFKSIITQVGIAESTNAQFLHTLGERIYLYVFGDRIGSLKIGGLAFYDNCEGSGEEHGISHVIKYYRQQKLSSRATPLKVNLDASTVLKAYLHGVSGGVVNTAQRMFQFSLDMALLPDTSEEEAVAEVDEGFDFGSF